MPQVTTRSSASCNTASKAAVNFEWVRFFLSDGGAVDVSGAVVFSLR
jgi:hypothetical protein